MLAPYRKISETDSQIVLQYNPLYSWFYVLLLLLLLTGFLINNSFFYIGIVVLVFAYVTARWVLGFQYMLQIRHGSHQGAIELTGNKYSFRNPLLMKIKK